MSMELTHPHDPVDAAEGMAGDTDLGDLLQELRVLLQGVQVLTGFLILLPFNQGFAKIEDPEKWVYLATFVCSMASLVLFSAVAAQHRLARPLRGHARAHFKQLATRLIVVGLVPFSAALVLATHLVVAEVLGRGPAQATAALLAALIGGLWWLLPVARKRGEHA